MVRTMMVYIYKTNENTFLSPLSLSLLLLLSMLSLLVNIGTSDSGSLVCANSYGDLK